MGCPYANIFGKPHEGVHKRRFLGFALVDTVLTILVAAATAWLFKGNFALHLLAWLFLGEILHYIFGVRTTFLEAINLLPECARKCGCESCMKKRAKGEPTCDG
jgi:hypothetical protein